MKRTTYFQNRLLLYDFILYNTKALFFCKLEEKTETLAKFCRLLPFSNYVMWYENFPHFPVCSHLSYKIYDI